MKLQPAAAKLPKERRPCLVIMTRQRIDKAMAIRPVLLAEAVGVLRAGERRLQSPDIKMTFIRPQAMHPASRLQGAVMANLTAVD